MAYSGGLYTKPIDSGLSNLSNLYLQGKMQVINMRAKVRKERSEELESYTKAASEIEATGNDEADKLYSQGANLLRDAIVASHQENILGNITRSEATARANNYISQASQIANTTKIVADKIEALDKGIADLKLDPVSKARHLRTWFTGQGQNQAVLKIKDEKTGEFINVPGQSLIAVEFDDNGKINYRKSFNYVDPNTNKIEVGTRMAPVGSLSDVNPSLIERFDANENVKEFLQTIGNTREVSMVRGEPAGDIKYTGSFRLGETDVYTRIISPGNLPDVSNRLEMELNTLASNDDVVISLLSQEFGARAPGDLGFTRIKSEEEINKLFGPTVVLGEDGKPTGKTIPKIYDEFGNQVVFTNKYKVEDPPGSGNFKEYLHDPTTFQLNEFGIEQISEDQRNLTKAIMRDKYLKAMNVTVDDYRERDRDPNTSTKIPSEVDFTTANYVKKNADGSINNSAGIDAQYLRNKISIAAGFIDDIRGDMKSNFGSDLLSQHQRGDRVKSTVQLSGQQKLLSERAPNVIGGVNLTYMSTPTKSGDAVLNYVTQDIKGTTITGGKLKSLGQIMVFDEGVDSEGDDTPIMVVLSGQVDLGKTSISASEPVVGGTAGVQRSRTISAEDFYIVESATELNSLYKMLWRQGDSPNSFKTILENKGYNIDGKKSGGKKDMLQAFKEYMNEVKTM